jgi:hypothetical protein
MALTHTQIRGRPDAAPTCPPLPSSPCKHIRPGGAEFPLSLQAISVHLGKLQVTRIAVEGAGAARDGPCIPQYPSSRPALDPLEPPVRKMKCETPPWLGCPPCRVYTR